MAEVRRLSDIAVQAFTEVFSRRGADDDLVAFDVALVDVDDESGAARNQMLCHVLLATTDLNVPDISITARLEANYFILPITAEQVGEFLWDTLLARRMGIQVDRMMEGVSFDDGGDRTV